MCGLLFYIKLKKIPNVRIIMKRRGAKAQRINFRESKEYGAKALSVHFAISKKSKLCDFASLRSIPAYT